MYNWKVAQEVQSILYNTDLIRSILGVRFIRFDLRHFRNKHLI